MSEKEREKREEKKTKINVLQLPHRQVRPVEVPDPCPPFPMVPRPCGRRRPAHHSLGDTEVGVIAIAPSSAEVAVVCSGVGRSGGDHPAQQRRGLGLSGHRALRQRVLNVHPADQLGEARELLGRDADVFEHGPRPELALRRGQSLRRRRARRRRKRDDVGGSRAACGGRGQGPRGSEQRVEAGGWGVVLGGREGLERVVVKVEGGVEFFLARRRERRKKFDSIFLFLSRAIRTCSHPLPRLRSQAGPSRRRAIASGWCKRMIEGREGAAPARQRRG